MHNYDYYKQIVNDNLVKHIPEISDEVKLIKESMEYSLMASGKRLRPVLLLATCEFCDGDINNAIPFACALEFIHTYSLIHDDLPAMDNDDLRRGKPTNHKVYGEDIAILAGDALLNSAFEIMNKEMLNNSNNMNNYVKASYEIVSRSGVSGMIAGQVADIKNEYNDVNPEIVDFIDSNKTGKLITASVASGLAIAGCNDEQKNHDFIKYSEYIGKAFQVLDDILDFIGDPKLLGKNVGKDKDLGKCNYACIYGLDKAKEMLHELTSKAINQISKYNDVDFFMELANELENRKA